MAYKDIRAIGNDTEIDRTLNRVFVSHLRKAYVEIGEDNFCLPIAYENFAERIHNFKVRDDDIYLAAFPRTGTTWSEEMIWLILNDLDFEGAKKFIGLRFPFFDVQAIFGDNEIFQKTYEHDDSFTKLDRMDSPRCIKTHLHWYVLPEDLTSGRKRPKIIYVLRNPKDTCVSLYHQSRLLENYKGTFDEFCELFLAGRVPNAPFWKSVLSFWNRRHEINILFIRYKEMKENLPAVLKKVAAFLDKDISETQIQCLAEHLSFENMKKNPAVNHDMVVENFAKPLKMMVSTENTFIRSGKQGDYESVMSQELIDRFDIWTEENLKGLVKMVKTFDLGRHPDLLQKSNNKGHQSYCN